MSTDSAWLRNIFLLEREKPLTEDEVEERKSWYTGGLWTAPPEEPLPWGIKAGMILLFIFGLGLTWWKQDWLMFGFFVVVGLIGVGTFAFIGTSLPRADEGTQMRQRALFERLVTRWGSVRAPGILCTSLLRGSELDLYSVSEDEAFERLLDYARKKYDVETRNCVEGHVALCSHLLSTSRLRVQ